MNLHLKALTEYYEAERTKALAHLQDYFTKVAAIGEHSELQDEQIKWTERLANAEDCIETLERNFKPDGTIAANDG